MTFTVKHDIKLVVDLTIRDGRAAPVPDVDELKEFLKSQFAALITQGEKLMSLTKEQSDAFQKKLDALESNITTAVSTATADAVRVETDQISAQIKKLREQIAQGGPVSDADLAQLGGAVDATAGRLAASLGKGIADAIDKISQGDGGDDQTQNPPTDVPPGGGPVEA